MNESKSNMVPFLSNQKYSGRTQEKQFTLTFFHRDRMKSVHSRPEHKEWSTKYSTQTGVEQLGNLKEMPNFWPGLLKYGEGDLTD